MSLIEDWMCNWAVMIISLSTRIHAPRFEKSCNKVLHEDTGRNKFALLKTDSLIITVIFFKKAIG